MKKIQKRKALTLFAAVALSAVAVGAMANSASNYNANADVISGTDYWMENGAAVRYGANGNGLRFTFQIKTTAFNELKEKNAYVKYGVLIAPEDYLTSGKELTKENVFGEDAIYNWAEKDASGKWVYEKEYINGTETYKTQIVNLEAESFVDETVKIGGESVSVKEFYGSLINLLDGTYDAVTNPNSVNNVGREFRGVGYVAVSTNGVDYTYTLVGEDDNVRSMAYVAQLAIEDTSNDAPTNTQKEMLKNTYVSKVTEVAASFTQEYWLEGTDGVYVKVDSEVLNTYNGNATTVDDSVTAEEKVYAGYEFDETNKNNVVAGKVYANGKLTLKRYYKYVGETTDLGLVDTAANTTLDISALGNDGLTRKLYKVNGNVETEVSADLTGDTLSVAGLDGVYAVKALNEAGLPVATVTFDAYNAESAAVWNTVGGAAVNPETAATVTTTESAPDKEGTYYQIASEGGEYYFLLPAAHTKAYYELFANKSICLTFDTYLTASGSEATVAGVYSGTYASETWSKIPVGEWTKVKIPVEDILANWDSLATEGILQIGEYYQVEGGITPCTESVLYVGNIKMEVGVDLSTIEKVQDVKVKDSNGNYASRLVTVENSYDLNNLLGEEDKAKFALYEQAGEIAWTITPVYQKASHSAYRYPGEAPEAIAVADGIVDFENVSKRWYEVNATLTTEEGSAEIYNGSVDFYTPTEDVVFIDEIDLYQMTMESNIEGRTYAITENPAGKMGSYFTVNLNGTVAGFGLDISPVHSEAYYRAYKGRGIEIAFDFYNGTDSSGMNIPIGTIGSGNRPSKTWVTMTLTLDNFLTNWKNMFGSSIADEADLSALSWGTTLIYFTDAAKETTADFYFGNFRTDLTANDAVVDSAAKLIDVKDKAEYELTSLLSESAKAVYDKYAANYAITWKLLPVSDSGNVVGEAITVEDGVVDFGAVEKRLYKITASFENYGGTDIYTANSVDFHDSSEKLVWMDSIDLNKIRFNNGAASTTATIATAEELPTGAVSGASYYKITTTDCFGIMFEEEHSKAYYESYKGKGFEIVLDFYLNDESGKNIIFTGYTGGNTRTVKKWITESISLDTIIKNWATIHGTNTSGWSAFMALLNAGTTADVFVGNIRIEYAVTDAVENGTVALVDLKDNGTGYDLTGLFADDEAGKAVYDKYAALGELTWKLTPVNTNGEEVGETIILDGNVADLGIVAKRLYNVEIEAYITAAGKNAVIYTRQLDMYDSSEGLVWNTKLTADQIALYSGANTNVTKMTASEVNTELGKEGAVENAEYVKLVSAGDPSVNGGLADSYGFMFMPIHSKDYYALEAWAGYTLKFDMFMYRANDDLISYYDLDGVSKYDPIIATPVAQYLTIYGYVSQPSWSGNSTYRKQSALNTNWATVTLKLTDYMLATWDWTKLGQNSTNRMVIIENLVTLNTSKPITKADGRDITEVYKTAGSLVYSKKSTTYFGNFRTEAPVVAE